MIPGDDLEKFGHLSIRLWPPEKLPASLVLDFSIKTQPDEKVIPKEMNVIRNRRDDTILDPG